MPKQYEVYQKDGKWGFQWGGEFKKLESEKMARDFANYQHTYDTLSQEVARKDAVQKMEFDHGKLLQVRRELEEMKVCYPNHQHALISRHEELLEKLEKVIDTKWDE